ncbi:MAG: sigma-70 family RNA polymerase sigma factor [Spirosomaceae bacterium]|jgi:RNA polymerase sigma factor (sigma-70 family)|nr:sigma-70 family RNA polymerase sigma factor [Spirosomataceae bacterium]
MKEFDSDIAVVNAIENNQNLNKAVSFLYKNHYNMLEHLVIKNSGSTMDAEDMIQETMIVFIDMVRDKKYRGEASIKSVLYSITKNLWISKIRKTTQENIRIEKFAEESEIFQDDIVNQIQKRESKTAIEKILDKIGESCKKILTLFYYEELSFKEILEQTEYENEQVLRNKKYKCLKSLTDMIELSPSMAKTLKSSLNELK